MDEIQPSQFYVDEMKVKAISGFIREEKDTIIQVVPYQSRYVSVDGHTRLYYASSKGWQKVRAVISEPEDWVDTFVRNC